MGHAGIVFKYNRKMAFRYTTEVMKTELCADLGELNRDSAVNSSPL